MALPSFPATELAVQEAADLVLSAWINAAESLPAYQRGPYIRALVSPRSIEYPYQGNRLAAQVVNRAGNARSVEYGRPAVHLPEAINWASSPAARRSKRGVYYLIIPFRHRTRGRAGLSPTALASVLPSKVYQIARQLAPGQYLTSGPGNGRGVHAPGMRPYYPRYVRNIRLGYLHAAREERLRRVPGRGRGGSYMTFRTMREDSSGWWIPPQPGYYLARSVEQATRPVVTQMINAALAQDVDAMLDGMGEGRRP